MGRWWMVLAVAVMGMEADVSMCAYADLQSSPHFSFLPKHHAATPNRNGVRPASVEDSSRNPWKLPATSLLALPRLLGTWRDSPQTRACGIMLAACTAGLWTSTGQRFLSRLLPLGLRGRRRRRYLGRAAPVKAENEEERTQYQALPSVMTWNQPSNFLQGRKPELVLEATLPAMDGPETFYGLGCNETEFKLFLDYIAGTNLRAEEVHITSKYVDTQDENVRAMLRERWNSRHLLLKNKSSKNVMASDTRLVAEVKGYLKRMESFESEPMKGATLLQWLEEECGDELIQRCRADSDLSTENTQRALKEFLDWFKKEFPYYDKKCFHCEHAEGERLGSIRASEEEEEFLASRSEILRCPSCSRFSRFVRYNTVSKVIETRKGRCGEYSMLMYHIMQALGYQTRWVVDWTDHVWVEVDMHGSWLHLDACEAALDNKKMYVAWGKQHTYVIAFVRGACEDVTVDYVDDMEEVRKRRDLTDEDLKASLEIAQAEFLQELASKS